VEVTVVGALVASEDGEETATLSVVLTSQPVSGSVGFGRGCDRKAWAHSPPPHPPPSPSPLPLPLSLCLSPRTAPTAIYAPCSRPRPAPPTRVRDAGGLFALNRCGDSESPVLLWTPPLPAPISLQHPGVHGRGCNRHCVCARVRWTLCPHVGCSDCGIPG
jgi:hypothetical protein